MLEPPAPSPALPDELDLLAVFEQMARLAPPPSQADRAAWTEMLPRVPDPEARRVLEQWIEDWGEEA